MTVDIQTKGDPSVTHTRFFSRAVLFAAALFVGFLATAHAAPGQPQANGKTYGEWSAEWWQWVLSFPAATNPLLEQGDVDCSRGQSGPVWFLAGNVGGVSERRCTVRNKPLFFPLVNSTFFNDASLGEEFTVAEKRDVLDSLFDSFAGGVLDDLFACQLSATVDGEPTAFTTATARAQSPIFDYFAGPDDIFAPPGNFDPETVSDGHWVMLPRLGKGEHTIHFTGALCAVVSLESNPVPIFEVDVTYTVIVQD